MAKIGYQCEKCGALYTGSSAEYYANQCEADHKAREDAAYIKRFGWQHEPEMPGEYPTKIIVQFSANDRDFATYRLERIDFQGKIVDSATLVRQLHGK